MGKDQSSDESSQPFSTNPERPDEMVCSGLISLGLVEKRRLVSNEKTLLAYARVRVFIHVWPVVLFQVKRTHIELVAPHHGIDRIRTDTRERAGRQIIHIFAVHDAEDAIGILRLDA
jgi:hypothetical protein